MLALGEICFDPAPQTPFSNVPPLKSGFEVLPLGEMCFDGMGAVEKGV